jgi:hypothetical protein
MDEKNCVQWRQFCLMGSEWSVGFLKVPHAGSDVEPVNARASRDMHWGVAHSAI